MATSAGLSKKISSNLKIDVYDIRGKVVEKITLPKEVFGRSVNRELLAQAVRVYLANKRTGNASTKSRGEVKGSSRKIYRQKGTGRARHGSLRAPIFVHGGVAHGPKPRDFSLKLSKKMRKAALFSALSAKNLDGEITIVVGIEKINPKTKEMVKVMKALNVFNSGKTLLFVLPEKYENVEKSARNIAGVQMRFARELNAYEILQYNRLLFVKDAILKIQ